MAAGNLRGWSDRETGRPSAASAAVMNQIAGWSFFLLCGLVFVLVAFPSYGELKIGGSPNVAPSRLVRLVLLGLMFIILMIKPFSQFKNEIIPVCLSFWFAVALIKRPEQFEWVIRALGAAMVVVISVMVVEIFLKRNIFDGLLQVENFSTRLAFLDSSRDGVYRAKATFQHPLNLAHFLVSFGLLFLSKGLFHEQPFRDGLVWSLLGGVAIVCVYFTSTRSGLAIGVLLLLILLSVRYLIWLRAMKNRLIAIMLGLQLLWLPIVMSIGLYLVQDFVLGRTAEQRSSTVSRLIANFNGLEGVADSPLIGHGIGVGVTKGGVSWGGGYQYTVDNLFLLTALDNGIPAALLLLACFGVASWRLMPRWSELRRSNEVGLRVGLVMVFSTSVVMYFFYALTDLFELCFLMIAGTLCLPDRSPVNPRKGRDT